VYVYVSMNACICGGKACLSPVLLVCMAIARELASDDDRKEAYKMLRGAEYFPRVTQGDGIGTGQLVSSCPPITESGKRTPPLEVCSCCSFCSQWGSIRRQGRHVDYFSLLCSSTSLYTQHVILLPIFIYIYFSLLHRSNVLSSDKIYIQKY
jgi:hypothetical protein